MTTGKAFRLTVALLLAPLPFYSDPANGQAKTPVSESAAPIVDSPTEGGRTSGGPRGPVNALSTPVADFQFAGNLASRVAGADPLTETRIGSSFGEETVDGLLRPVRLFDAGNGLRLAAADSLISDSVYTIQMTVRLSDPTAGGVNFVKLIDFGDQTDDFGLYTVSNAGNPAITWFDGAGQPFGAGLVPTNDWVQIVLTRDSSDTITAYLDGVQQFTHVAAAGQTDVGGALVFLDDDSATGGNEISSGAIACLRIYPTALDPATVATLDCEPVKRVGINGQLCAYDSVAAAVAAAPDNAQIIVEAGHYNERIGLVEYRSVNLRAGQPGNNCLLSEPFPGKRAVIDGSGFTDFPGIGGILEIFDGSVSLRQIDLTNGSTGQGGLVMVDHLGFFSAFGSTLSNGTASADLVDIGHVLDTDDPAGGCIYAEDSLVVLEETTFINCRVLGPNGGSEPATGDGGAIHARAASLVLGSPSITMEDNAARNGGAIALVASEARLSDIFLNANTAENFGGAIAALDSSVELGFNTDFRTNVAGNRGGAIDLEGGSLLMTDLGIFMDNTAADLGGAIAISNGDLAIRPSRINGLQTLFDGNSAEFGGAIAIQGATTGTLPGPTIDGALFDGNTGGIFGGALLLLGTNAIEIVDSSFVGNAAIDGGAIYSQTSSSIIRSSSECKAFEFSDPNRYCSQFLNNVAASGSAIHYRDDSTNNRVFTTAFVGNSGANAVELLGNGNELLLESVWMFFNDGDAVVVGGDSAIQITHATLHDNTGRAYVGQDSSTLFMFNSIAWANAGGGVSSLGTGLTTTACNFDQSNVAGPNIDPLLVTNADGLSHLSLDSPAVDACPNAALGQFDLEGRNRVFNFAPDAGAFEANDILFQNGFE